MFEFVESLLLRMLRCLECCEGLVSLRVFILVLSICVRGMLSLRSGVLKRRLLFVFGSASEVE